MTGLILVVLVSLFGFCVGLGCYGDPQRSDTQDSFFNGLAEGGRFCARTHKVLTEDNIILRMHEVYAKTGATCNIDETTPTYDPNKVFFLQHGLLDASDSWVRSAGSQDIKHKGLAFFLVDNGYSVFMGNSRGNKYSRHTLLESGGELEAPTSDDQFWSFSWDEMAKHDLPAFLTCVKDRSGSKDIAYVGHSQGTTQMFAALAMTYNRDKTGVDKRHKSNFYYIPKNIKITHFFALAPVVYIKYHESEALKISIEQNAVNYVSQALITTNKKIQYMLGLGTRAIASFQKGRNAIGAVCGAGMDLVAGSSAKEVEEGLLAANLKYFPSGTSVADLKHWMQCASAKTEVFESKDKSIVYADKTGPLRAYFEESELAKWKGSLPEKSNIYLFLGCKDKLATPFGVHRLRARLSLPKTQLLEYPSYDHNSFIWGKNVAVEEGPYADILRLHRNDQVIRKDAEPQCQKKPKRINPENILETCAVKIKSTQTIISRIVDTVSHTVTSVFYNVLSFFQKTVALTTSTIGTFIEVCEEIADLSFDYYEEDIFDAATADSYRDLDELAELYQDLDQLLELEQ